jgi:hypothetical protein
MAKNVVTPLFVSFPVLTLSEKNKFSRVIEMVQNTDNIDYKVTTRGAW